jgi:hypothetical protein
VPTRSNLHQPPWFSDSFDYGFPPPAPVAVPGCGVCAGMAATLAAITGNASRAADVRVLMRRHLRAAHK